MRVATFNILHGRSTEDGRVDLDRLASAVREIGADVLALQEVDRSQDRSGHADQAAVAAAAMDAVEHRFVAALSDRGAAYGVALVSRYPLAGWRTVRLPRLPGAEPRVALVALVDTPHGRLTVVSTHLSFVTGWNRRQLRHLVAAVGDARRPLVLAGDLNMGPERAARTSGLRPLAEHPTFPAGSPSRQIDHLLGDGPVRALGSAAHRLPVSDHRALVADLEIG